MPPPLTLAIVLTVTVIASPAHGDSLISGGSCPTASVAKSTRLEQDASSLLQVNSDLKRGGDREAPASAFAKEDAMAATAAGEAADGAEALVQLAESQRFQVAFTEQQRAADLASARFAVGFVVMLVAVVIVALMVLCYVARSAETTDKGQDLLSRHERAQEVSPVQGMATKVPFGTGGAPSPSMSKAERSPRSPRNRSPGQSPAGWPRSPNSPRGVSATSRVAPCVQLSPELSWSIVPATSKLFLNVPAMLQTVSDQEQSLKYTVTAKGINGGYTDMIATKLLRHAKDPNDESGIVEYLSVSLPENPNEELVTCALAKPNDSPPEYHIYLFGSQFFGTIMEDQRGSGSFTLWHDNQQPVLIATLQGGFATARTIEVVTSQTKDPVAMGTCSGDNYSVECFPHCDILLAIVMLASVDRLSAAI